MLSFTDDDMELAAMTNQFIHVDRVKSINNNFKN